MFRQCTAQNVLLGALLAACGFLTACRTAPIDSNRDFELKVPAPRSLDAGARPGPFEKQFQLETGQSNLTLRSSFEWPLLLHSDATNRVSFDFKLGAWPESLKPLARLWIAVGRSETDEIEGPLRLIFSQGGANLHTLLEMVRMDGVILMGYDFPLEDGPVTVDIDNRGYGSEVRGWLHAIVYFPGGPPN